MDKELAYAIVLGVAGGMMLFVCAALGVYHGALALVDQIKGSPKGRAQGPPVTQTPKGEAEGEGMGLFDGVENAKVGQGGIYFLPGKYRVEVVKCFTLRSRKRDDLFIVECMIHESDNPDRKPGTKASWVVNFDNDMALGNIKGFLAACNGINPNDEKKVDAEITEDVCEYAVDEKDNPLAGTMVWLVAVNKKTKKDADFTLHLWSPLEVAA